MPVSRNRSMPATAERVLHPTKGYRKVSVERSRAAFLTQQIAAGRVPADLGLMRNFLINGA
ncbi:MULTISPECIES: hypothetical protein [unclassified Rhizobium]|uniref:hypothetical protein n=1 Tax=unclassified Rhizobium TaxID=2613769 RepID=UPI00177EDDAD|nr:MULTISPECIES: hypothetical protein [unclassified Rhizobium]MBD8687056.1 hypothetical protein [Rhizobium sp. CFBP 13644]MBD8691141.1 hypothetical protein [Rhizobium sp. CFBP 13717]